MSRQRIRKVENEASQARADVALHAAFQHQIRSLKKDITVANEEALTHMTEAEKLEAEVEKLESDIAAAELVFAEFSGNVEREMGVAQHRLDKLAGARKSRLSPSIEPEIFQTYERLLTTRKGVALALLEDRISSPTTSVPVNLYVRVARGTQVVTCPSCDRIFYVAGA